MLDARITFQAWGHLICFYLVFPDLEKQTSKQKQLLLELYFQCSSARKSCFIHQDYHNYSFYYFTVHPIQAGFYLGEREHDSKERRQDPTLTWGKLVEFPEN